MTCEYINSCKYLIDFPFAKKQCASFEEKPNCTWHHRYDLEKSRELIEKTKNHKT